MNKKRIMGILSITIIGVLLLIIIALFSGMEEKRSQVIFNLPTGEYRFDVELAESAIQQARGLMLRKSLGENKGMLFIFGNEGIHSFWMKNTFIPLDMIWINQNKEVVFIKENAQPCSENFSCPSINPNKNAKYVLEINGGMAEKIGLKIGDKITLPNF